MVHNILALLHCNPLQLLIIHIHLNAAIKRNLQWNDLLRDRATALVRDDCLASRTCPCVKLIRKECAMQDGQIDGDHKDSDDEPVCDFQRLCVSGGRRDTDSAATCKYATEVTIWVLESSFVCLTVRAFALL